MDPIPVGQALLQKVVVNLGDLYAAAQKLGVPPSLMNRFLDGTSIVPDDIVLRAIDIVLGEFKQSASAASRPFSRSRRNLHKRGANHTAARARGTYVAIAL